MVNAELIFEAYLNAAVPYIDMKWLADPIIYKWYLTVKNQSNQTLWFKLFNAIPNWDFGISLPGSDELELGSIGAGSSISPVIDMVREVPVGETYDGDNLTLKAYTDAGYTNEIASADKFVTIDIQDVENWTDVEIFDFEDGTAQGWTLTYLSVSSDKSVEAGGYSIKGSNNVGDFEVAASRAINIPNRNKCNLSFFFASAGSPANLRVSIDGVLIFNYPSALSAVAYWRKFSVNLSPYKNQSRTIEIRLYSASSSNISWIDRIVVAGKD